ncbi:MAG: hypothetical protein WA064_04585 [Candidatus Moraniibacteriota bacterium]
MKHEMQSRGIDGITCTCGELIQKDFSFYSTEALFWHHKNRMEKEEKECEEFTKKYDGTNVLQILAGEDGPLVITREEKKYSHDVVAIQYCYWVYRQISINLTRVAFFKKNKDGYVLIKKDVDFSVAFSWSMPDNKEITLDVIKEVEEKERKSSFRSGVFCGA